MTDFLHEFPGKTVFEGRVLRIEHDWGVDYEVHNGGWMGEDPDTWLCEMVLARFEGRLVRVTIEDLGPSKQLQTERVARDP